MNKKPRIYGLLLLAITSYSVNAGDFKPFLGMELVSSQPNTPIDQRDALWNLGVDYKINSNLSGGLDVGLSEDGVEQISKSDVLLKSNLYAKYNWFSEARMSPFIVAGYTTARINENNCLNSPTANGDLSVSGDSCAAKHSNTFGTTYGVGLTIKENRKNGSAFMIKYLRTTGVTNLEMDTLGVSFSY